MLEAALRLARLLALASLREDEVEVDAAAIQAALTGIREQLELIRKLKTQLTSIGTTASACPTPSTTCATMIVARRLRGRDGAQRARPDGAG